MLKFNKYLAAKIMLSVVWVFFFVGVSYAQDGNEEAAEGVLLPFIINGLVGVLLQYGQRAMQAIGGDWDWKYWWKDNNITLLVTLVLITIISLVHTSNPQILAAVLVYLDITIDTTTGNIGSITFGFAFASIVHGIIKKFLKTSVVKTDGNGTPIESK